MCRNLVNIKKKNSSFTFGCDEVAYNKSVFSPRTTENTNKIF